MVIISCLLLASWHVHSLINVMKVIPAQNILHMIFGGNEWNFVLFCIILMKSHLVEMLNKAIIIITIIIYYYYY